MRLVTLGVGAMNSPRFAPAGLLVAHRGVRVMIDGGPGAEPPERLDAWLVTDERAELMAEIRRSAAARGLLPCAGSFRSSVAHRGQAGRPHQPRRLWLPHPSGRPHGHLGPGILSIPAVGAPGRSHVRGGLCVESSDPVCRRGRGPRRRVTIAEAARRWGVRRLVFAHVGRPTLWALAQGATPPFGEFAVDGQVFLVRRRAA